MRRPGATTAFALAFALAARAAPPLAPPPAEPKWETVTIRPFTVKTRARPGTQVREVWATGVLAAPPEHIQAALLDGESFPRFMPYVKEVRMLKVSTTDGSWFSYQKVEPPLVAPRDCVYRIWLEEALARDGTGRFRNRWVAVPGVVPNTPGAVRTVLNEGSWEVVPATGGKSRVVYRFIVDPGGNVPSWLADMANRSGIAEVFRALEKEAKRRSAEPGPSKWPGRDVPDAPEVPGPVEAGGDAGHAPEAGEPPAAPAPPSTPASP